MKAFSVRSGRLTYPTARPMPAMQISPMPPFSASRDSSGARIRSLYVGSGTPMVTGLSGASSVQVAVTVASVGP